MFDKNKFKGRIVELGLSVDKVANLLGINAATLYRKMNGDSDFSRGEIQLLKDVLNLSGKEMEDIFFKQGLTETQSHNE